MEKIDIKYTLKSLWPFIAIFLYGVTFAIVLGLILRSSLAPYKSECPVCGKSVIEFYQNKETEEILGCDYCIIKTNNTK